MQVLVKSARPERPAEYDPTLEDLGLWRVLTLADYTCVFPAGFEPDREIVDAIRREVYPWYVPLWVRKRYRAPTGQLLLMGWHAIGRWTPHADDAFKDPVNAPRPTVGFPFEGGVVYSQRTLAIAWPKGSLGRRLLVPPLGIPFDWDLLYWMKAAGYRLLRRPGPIKQDILLADAAASEVKRAHLASVQANARARLKSDRALVRRGVDEELHKIEHPRQYERPTFKPKPFVEIRVGQAVQP